LLTLASSVFDSLAHRLLRLLEKSDQLLVLAPEFTILFLQLLQLVFHAHLADDRAEVFLPVASSIDRFSPAELV
jgi:hypothetical protein